MNLITFAEAVFLQLSLIIKKINKMNNKISQLQSQVQQQKTVVDSAVALLQGLKQRLDDAISSEDENALQQLSNDLGASTEELANAVVANTPSENVTTTTTLPSDQTTTTIPVEETTTLPVEETTTIPEGGGFGGDAQG